MKAKDLPTAARLFLCVVLLAHAALASPQDPCGTRLRHSNKQCDFPSDFCNLCQQRNTRSIEIREIRDQTKIVLQHMDNYRKAIHCIDDGFTIASAYNTAKSAIPNYSQNARNANFEEVLHMLRELREYAASVNSTDMFVKYMLCDMKSRIDVILNVPQNHTKSPDTTRIEKEFNKTDNSETQANRQLKVIVALFDTLYRRLDFLHKDGYKPENASKVAMATIPTYMKGIASLQLNEVMQSLHELRDFIKTVKHESVYDEYSLGDRMAHISATLRMLPDYMHQETYANRIKMEFDRSHTDNSTRTIRQHQVVFTVYDVLYKRLDFLHKDVYRTPNASNMAKKAIPKYFKGIQSLHLNEVIQRFHELRDYIKTAQVDSKYDDNSLSELISQIDGTLNTLPNHIQQQGYPNAIKIEFDMQATSSEMRTLRQHQVIYTIFDLLYKRLAFLQKDEYKTENALRMAKVIIPKYLKSLEGLHLNEVIQRFHELRDYVQTVEDDGESDQSSLSELTSQIDATLKTLPNHTQRHKHTNAIEKEFDKAHANNSPRAIRQRQVIFTIFDALYKSLSGIFKELQVRSNRTMTMLKKFKKDGVPRSKDLHLRHHPLKMYRCHFNILTIENFALCYRSLQQELRDYRDMTDKKDIKQRLKTYLHHVNKYVKKLKQYMPAITKSSGAKGRRKNAKGKDTLKEKQFIAYFYSRCEKLNNQLNKVLEQIKLRKWTH